MAQVRAAAFQCRARRRERRVAASAHQRLKKASLSLWQRSWVKACVFGLTAGTAEADTCAVSGVTTGGPAEGLSPSASGTAAAAALGSMVA